MELAKPIGARDDHSPAQSVSGVTVNRRSVVNFVLASTAAIAAAPLTSAEASLRDPIFAAIDAHRKAIRETNDQETDEEVDRFADIEYEVLAKVLSITPTSIAGVIALSRYAQELLDRGYLGVYMTHPDDNAKEVDWFYCVHRNVANALAGMADGAGGGLDASH
jgi:hypothetical protein